MTIFIEWFVSGFLALSGTLFAPFISFFSTAPESRVDTAQPTLTAEQVVDLEVQAQQKYEQAGGTY